MSITVDQVREAREALQAKDWRKAQGILHQCFPAAVNSKFIGDLLKTATAAQREGEQDKAGELYWLAIEIYESGRDENAEVLTAIKQLAEMLKKSGRQDEFILLCDRTFTMVLTAAEGLNRIVKSLTRQLSDQEQSMRK